MKRAACLLAALSFLAPMATEAQSCAPPTEAWGDPWPETVSVPSMDVSGPAVPLTRQMGESLRCQLQRRLRRPVTDLPSDVRGQVRGQRLGPLWLDAGRPRIGEYWLQSQPDGTLELSTTLRMSRRARLGLVARFEPDGDRWRLVSVHAIRSHARRESRHGVR